MCIFICLHLYLACYILMLALCSSNDTHKLETDCYVLMLVLWSSSGTHIDVRLTATFLCWHHAALTVPTLGFRLLLHLYAGTMQLQQYPQRLETDCYILMLTLCNSNGIHIDFSLTATSLYWHHAGPMVPTDFSLIAHLSTPSLCKEFPQLVWPVSFPDELHNHSHEVSTIMLGNTWYY